MPTSSPGTALVERLRLEDAFTRAADLELDAFLAAMRVLAEAGYSRDRALTAAGVPFDLTLGNVLGAWDVASTRIMHRLARIMNVKVDPHDSDYLRSVHERLRRNPIGEAAYSTTSEVITRGIEKGWSQKRLTRAIRTTLRREAPHVMDIDLDVPSWGAVMARMARTEATAAYAYSCLNDLAAQGFSRKRWVAHHDAFTRPTHSAADGQTQPLSASFTVGSASLLIPAQPGGESGETENCRCVIVGVP